MASAKDKKGTAANSENLPATNDALADLMASLSPEERAELLALTGQDAAGGGTKLPTIKVNYCDVPDVNGNEIKKGNFVFDQSSKTVEMEVTDEDGDITTEDRMEDLGVDLGKSITVTALLYRQQYNYYNDDAKQRCSSQIFLRPEVPVGNTLKFECQGGKCPRRKDGLDKKEKCACQNLLYVLVDVNGEKKAAVMYVKGSSFFPFNDYIKAAGPIPLFFAPTKLKNKMEKQGTVTYFVTSFELDTANPYPALERKEYQTQAEAAKAMVEDFKKQQFQKTAQKQLVDKSAGEDAVPFMEDDDITF